MDRKVVKMFFTPSEWDGSKSLTCGTIELTLECDTAKIPKGSCYNYKLTVRCGGETIVVYPSYCICNPFRLDFIGIVLTSCCNGIIDISITGVCPPPSCADLNCCCGSVPAVWNAISDGWANFLTLNECPNYDGNVNLPVALDPNPPHDPIIGPFRCLWANYNYVEVSTVGIGGVPSPPVRGSCELEYNTFLFPGPVSITGWQLRYLATDRLGNTVSVSVSNVIPAADFNCFGMNRFVMNPDVYCNIPPSRNIIVQPSP